MIYYNRIIDPMTPDSASDAIKDYINQFVNSPEYLMYTVGEAYYRTENIEIMARYQNYYCPQYDKDGNYAGATMEKDPYKANNQLPSAFSKLLTDQKVNYLLGNNVSFGKNNKDIYERLGRRSPKKIKQVAKAASKKSIGWANVFNNANEFDFNVIKPEHVIPLYDPELAEELNAVIYFFSKLVTDKDGESGLVTRVEVWDKLQVTVYQETKPNTQIFLLMRPEDLVTIQYPIIRANPHMHFVEKVTLGTAETIIDSQSWGRVPFIQMYNNDEQLYDLSPVKSYVDAYDVVNSEFANSLEEVSDFYWILKGYGAESTAEFLDHVRKFKVLKLDEGGGADAKTIDLPHEARTVFLNGLSKDIFKWGMGVDTDQLSGSSLTTTAIKAAFSNLRLKSLAFQDEVTDFLDKLMWFVNRHADIYGLTLLEDFRLTYNYATITNDTEDIENIKKMIGFAPTEILYENLIYTKDDPVAALKLMDAEHEKDVNEFATGQSRQEVTNGNNE